MTATALLAVGLFGSTSAISLVALRGTGRPWPRPSRRRGAEGGTDHGARCWRYSGIRPISWSAWPWRRSIRCRSPPCASTVGSATWQGSARRLGGLVDDPVTTVLVILFAGLAIRAGSGNDDLAARDLLMIMPAATLLENVLLVIGAALIWGLLLLLPGRPGPEGPPSRSWRWAATSVLLVVGGPRDRPIPDARARGRRTVLPPRHRSHPRRATSVAFAIATLLLGLVLADRHRCLQGVVLGVVTYLVQVVVGLLLTCRCPATGCGWRWLSRAGSPRSCSPCYWSWSPRHGRRGRPGDPGDQRASPWPTRPRPEDLSY